MVQDGWQSWTYEQSGIGPAKLEQDSRWTYIGFQVPVTSAGPLVDGEITLHYTIKPGSLSGFRLPAGIVSPPKHPQQGPAGGEHHTPSDDLMVLARRIRDPAARQRFEQALRTLEPIRSTPRPHRISVTVNPRIAVRKPSTGPAHEGRLTRARAREGPVGDSPGLSPVPSPWLSAGLSPRDVSGDGSGLARVRAAVDRLEYSRRARGSNRWRLVKRLG